MRERRVEVFDNGFGASLQHVPEYPLTSEHGTDVGSHGNLSRVRPRIASACCRSVTSRMNPVKVR